MNTQIINILKSIDLSDEDILNIKEQGIIELCDATNIQAIITNFLELGMTNEDMQGVININPLLLTEDIEDINTRFNLLELEDINNIQIKEILLQNAFYLSNSIDNTKNTLKLLKKLGFSLPIIFEQNSNILNLTNKDIDVLIKYFEKKGVSANEMVDILEWRSELIDLTIDEIDTIIGDTQGYEAIVNTIYNSTINEEE
jgi:hypothetical protein